MKYMVIEIREKKESEGQLTEADVENYEKRINRFKTMKTILTLKKRM